MTTLKTWLPLALTVVLDALSIVKVLPPSQPVTVALVVLTALAAAIPAVEGLLQQAQASAERIAGVAK